MPYSVSVPITRRTLISSSLMPSRTKPACSHDLPEGERASKVLPGVRHGVDRAACLGAGLAGDQGPDVDDALALLAGDAGPVVRVRGVRQVLVLAELVDARGQQVTDPHALLPGLQELLDGHLLGPGHDVLDHGAGVEVLEVQHFLVAVG